MFRWHHAYLARLTPEDLPAPRIDVRVRWALASELNLLREIRPSGHYFEDLFRRGQTCAVGFLDGQPVSMNWFDPSPVHVSRDNAFEFEAAPDGIWSFADYVRPEMRRRGIYTAHSKGLFDLLAESAIRKIYCGIYVEDARSVGAHLRLGYRLLYRLRTVRVLGLTCHWVNDLSRGTAMLRRGVWTSRVPR